MYNFLVMKASMVVNSAEDTTTASSYHAQEFKKIPRDVLLKAYKNMLLSRKIDDKEIRLKNQSKAFFQISGAGHEAILTAAAMHLRPGYDWFFPYYRDRALCLWLGVSTVDMLLAAVGAQTDPASAGRQMPSHWSSKKINIPSQSSAVATQCLHAIGCAEATVRAWRDNPSIAAELGCHKDEVTYLSVGDGATSEGEFWESLNTACLESLPIIYLIEDNGYAISVPVEAQTPGGDISRIVEAFPGLRVLRCDGTDFISSYRTMEEAVTWARRRMGPVLVHAHVTRPYSHSLSDDETLYKTSSERKAESTLDPILRLEKLLKDESLATDAELEEILKSVESNISTAADRALEAPKPDPSTAADFVFSPTLNPESEQFISEPVFDGQPATMVTAINRTLRDEMARNKRILVFGQDVADVSREEVITQVKGKGGVFKVTHGLQRQFGSNRVFNSPLAEANIVGRAIGLALRGFKPVIEIQFFDYIWPAMMQIRDEMAMLRYRSANVWSCPIVIRAPIGGYLRGGAPYHSQSGVSIFAHCPGVRIVFPSTALDAAGLFRTSIRCEDPVLFLEHKHLYRQTYTKSEYPGENYMLPFGQAALRREGSDVTIITWGALVQRSLLAAQQAEKEGISVAVVDLRTIVPYDWNTIASLVQKTNRVIVVHEDQLTCGFGAEIAARISDELFSHLDAPVKRVAALDCPVAYAPELEEAILPTSQDVLRAIQDISRY